MDERRQPRDTDAIESVEAEPVRSSRLGADEVCVRLGINRDVLDVCIRWQVIEPEPADGGAWFTDRALERIGRAVRLHYDLGVNWAGVAVMLDLLDRLEALERELERRAD
ncbi:MAG TPA: chaperone modulator CbpM [Nitrospirales bacterium]|nr:chaperone modulator CbpM [Nitrospirales bacterium]